MMFLFLLAAQCEARHILWASLSVCLSVTLASHA